MCKICNNKYKMNLVLIIEEYQNLITIPPPIQGLIRLDISNCPNLTIISNVNGLIVLDVHNCKKITTIPINQELHKLYISYYPNLPLISTIENLNCLHLNDSSYRILIPINRKLNELYVCNCFNVKFLQSNHQELKKLSIFNCKNLHNIITKDKYEIKQYLSILRITQWFKYHKHIRVLWKIAEYYTKKKYAPKYALKYLSLD